MPVPSSAGPPVPTASELLRLAVAVAAEAAALARRTREVAITRVHTKSTDTDVVTEADRAVEGYVADALRAAHRHRLSGSAVTEMGQALVATGFGYDRRRRAHQGGVLAGLISGVRDIRRFGASAFDLCQAAEGLVDAFYEKGLNLWDRAAGGLVATEAGGGPLPMRPPAA